MKINESLPPRSRYFVALVAVLLANLGLVVTGPMGAWGWIGVIGAVMAAQTGIQRDSGARWPVAVVVIAGVIPLVATGVF